jgi:hypothetical protein
VPAQVKSLAELGWFLSLGTAAQLFAVGVVVVKLLMAPMRDAPTELIHTGAPAASVVAIMNLIFACASYLPLLCLTCIQGCAHVPVTGVHAKARLGVCHWHACKGAAAVPIHPITHQGPWLAGGRWW